MLRSDIPLVDLHSHILPGVDDGARNDIQALEMLRAAEADGINIIAATPHSHHIGGQAVLEVVNRLRETAAGAGISIDIVPGHEGRIAPDLAERYQRGDLIPLNCSRYQLIELHFQEWPRDLVERSIARVQAAGLTPVLAHPERFTSVQNDLAWIERLRDLGILVQINSHSLTGYHGPEAQVTAESLVERCLVHVIASDAHNAGRRTPVIRTALERAAIIAGVDYADWMMANALAIVSNEPVVNPWTAGQLTPG